jgi:hypothetical protein
MRRSTSGSSGALRAGMLKLGVRWNTKRCAACSAMIGIDWMADEPVPMMPTRCPLKSTPSCGQLPVWYHGPRKSSSPGNFGSCATDRQPIAMMQNRAETTSPRSVRIVHRAAVSS